jgi:hypothetical protein
MVAKRVRIESISKGEDIETGKSFDKVIEEEKGEKIKILPWVLVIMIILAGYHTYDAYK